MAVKFLLPTQKLLITLPELTTSLTPQLLLNILHKTTMKSSTSNSSSGPYLCIPKPPTLAVGGRLVIERGRYETPIIPRENRWCLHCYFTTGVKTLEDEIHALATCPLYNVVRGRFGFSPDQNELIDSLSDQSLTPARATTIAKTIHAILSINEKHVEYYKSPHFHNNCGSCVIL